MSEYFWIIYSSSCTCVCVVDERSMARLEFSPLSLFEKISPCLWGIFQWSFDVDSFLSLHRCLEVIFEKYTISFPRRFSIQRLAIKWHTTETVVKLFTSLTNGGRPPRVSLAVAFYFSPFSPFRWHCSRYTCEKKKQRTLLPTRVVFRHRREKASLWWEFLLLSNMSFDKTAFLE